jgi:hypothetical protein
MGILSKTIDTVKDVGKGVIDTVLDPFGTTRGTTAAQKLVDEGQGYLNTLRDNIRVNTQFWSDHQKMLGDYTQYEWKEALLSREEEQEKIRLKDTGKILPPNYRQKLIDSGAAAELYTLYEEKMNKAKDFKLSGGLEYDDENIKANILKHSRGSKQVIDRAARQLFNSYGFDKDLFAALGFGRDRTLVSQKMGTEGSTMGNYDFLLQAEDGPIKQKFISRLSAELDLLNSDKRFKKTDVAQLTTMFEKMNIDYKPIIKDAMTESELLVNPRAEASINAKIKIESGVLDASTFPKSDARFVISAPEKFGVPAFRDIELSNVEMVDKLWNQRKRNTVDEGGNAFVNFMSDWKQLTSLLTNVATKKEFDINVTATQNNLDMVGYGLIKDSLDFVTLDINLTNFMGLEDPYYIDYKGLTVEKKLAFIDTIGDTLIEAGGNKVAIEETLPLIKERMKEALSVTDNSIIKAIEASVSSRTYNSQKEANKHKNTIATMYRLDTDKTSYVNSLIDDKFKAQETVPLEEQMQNTFDPLSASLNPTSNLNQDIYTQGVSENIKDEMLKETPVQEEGDTLLEGFLKGHFKEVPNFDMNNPKHKALFNSGEIVFGIGNEILQANEFLSKDRSAEIKAGGKFLKRKAKSLLSKAGDVFENVRDPYMIEDSLLSDQSLKGKTAPPDLSDEEQAGFYGVDFTTKENGIDVARNVLTRAVNIAPNKDPQYDENAIEFLMAVANVESQYGRHPDTYNNPKSSAYGMMQIIASKSMVEVQRMFLPEIKKTNEGKNIRSYNEKIISKYGSDFDLSKMTREDMGKPQHSSFMARAYFLRAELPIPYNKKEWGLYWLNNYKQPKAEDRTEENDKENIEFFNKRNNIR